jgi:hypothetical protein
MGAEAMNSFPKALRSICDRPEIFVGERRFWTVAAWLGGYSTGLTEAKDDDNQIGLDGFRDWLSKRLYESHGIERNLVWSAYIARLYPNDDDALAQLPVLFDEFVSEKDKAQGDQGSSQPTNDSRSDDL